MKKIILTGFDPFDKLKINPSGELVNALREEDFPGCELHSVILPTVYGESSEILISKIIDLKPDLVVSFGLAAKSKKISLERFAINIDDCKLKDNRGVKRKGVPIVPHGREAYLSRLPLEKIVKNLRRYKIKSAISNYCGTFVCNHLMYSALYYITAHTSPFRYGFVHIPKLNTMRKGKKSGMFLEKLVKAAKIIVETSLEEDRGL